MFTKESWAKLSDNDKTKFIRKFCEMHSLNNFDYAKAKEFAEKMKNVSCAFINNSNPCIVLRNIDPILTQLVLSWMYSEIEITSEDGHVIKNNCPFAGFGIEEIYFDKSSLMEYSDEEKEILNKAVEILTTKGLSKNGY